MGKTGFIHICVSDSTGHLGEKGNRNPRLKLTYENVKREVLAVGRYSVFDATSSPQRAKLFTRLDHDPEIKRFLLGFPWIGVKLAREPEPKEQPR